MVALALSRPAFLNISQERERPRAISIGEKKKTARALDLVHRIRTSSSSTKEVMYPLNCLISAAISSLVMDSGSAGASSSSAAAVSSSSSSEAAFLAAFFPAAKCAMMECFVFVAEEPPPNRATPSCVEELPEEDNLYRAADLPATNDPEHANATMPRPYATFLSDIDDDA